MANTSNSRIEAVRFVSAELTDEDADSNAVHLEVGEDEYNINLAYANEAGTVYVQQGQYVIPVSGHTVVLQDDGSDFEQYVINDIGEELQDAEQTEEEIGQPIIYYTGKFATQSQLLNENEKNTIHDGVVDEGSVDENTNNLPKQIKLEQSYIDGDDSMQDDIDLQDNLIQLQQETSTENVIITSSESGLGQLQPSQYQYAILKNGKLHLQTVDVVDTSINNQFSIVEDDDQHQQLQEQLAAFQQSINMDETANAPATVNLDKITGRNLITGQTVTLDSYFDKLQRRLATADVTRQPFTYHPKKKQRLNSHQDQQQTNTDPAENSFINKKVVVGKTANGKRIVGKILRILSSKNGEDYKSNVKTEKMPNDPIQKVNAERQQTEAATSTKKIAKDTTTKKSQSNDESEGQWNDPEEPQPHIIIKKHVITRENFDYSIGKTLSGLMGLETVQRRLQDRNLVVKFVEKVYDHAIDSFSRTVSYVYGHMKCINVEDENSENKGWVFVLHNGTTSVESSPTENLVETDILESSDSEEPVQQTLLENDEPTSISKPTSYDKNKGVTIDTDEIKDVSLEMEDVITEYNETASLTIITTVDKYGKKSTRVNLSPPQSENRCHICHKEFKTSLQMRKHVSNVHVCEKSAKCELCDKTFANQTVLQRHRKIHTGERWYECAKCSKSFNTAGSLKRHLTVHDPSLRPLECSVCVQRFTDESSLRKHLLIHTGIRAYVCEICNRAFVNQGDLNFHRRIHDPVKQFSCEVCGREFSRHSNLMRHSEIHRGASALHRCDICGCSYSFISSLTRHIVQKHIGHQQQQ